MRQKLVIGAIAIVVATTVVGYFKWTPAVEIQAEKMDNRPRILAFNDNFLESMVMTADCVEVRAVTDAELKDYIENRPKYMAPFPQAVDPRILDRNVYAGEPVLKDHFGDSCCVFSTIPAPQPGMLAVDVSTTKERAAGGTIRAGDFVDVQLTTMVCADPGCKAPVEVTATIATNLKVLYKRANRQINGIPLAPIDFKIEANPYRAALFEFSKNRGVFTLLPTSLASKKVGPDEAKLETLRGISITEKRAAISERDLEDIFGLPKEKDKVNEPLPKNVGFVGPLREEWVPCATCPGGKKLIVR